MLYYHIGNICWKRRVKRQKCGQRCNVRTPDWRNSCANEFNYLLLRPPWRHTVCPCFRLYILPPPLLSLHLPMQLSTESQSFSIRVIMFLGGRITLKDSTCRDLYIISWINALYITAMVKLAHAGQVFVYIHVHTCRLKGVATIGIIMPQIVSICETRVAAYSEWYKWLMVT